MIHRSTATATHRPEFVTLIAVYQFVTAGILFLISCLIPAVFIPALIFSVGGSGGAAVSMALAAAALGLLIGFGVASAIVGWGLLRMREWARMGALVLAAFALIGFPIWTIAAILVLVYLTSDEARSAFAGRTQTREQGDPRYHDALAASAAYKTEPPTGPGQSPLDETRAMTAQPPGETAYGGTTGETLLADEAQQIEPIPMPPPSDPAAATETLYDEEADVSDHYQRWKASLPEESADSADIEETREIEAASEQPTLEIEATETPELPAETEPDKPEPERKYFRPPEEAGMDDRILRPRAEDENGD